MLSDPKNAPYFKASQDRKFYIAMCFKNNPGQCGNSSAATGWRSLVTSTLSSLTAVIEQQGLNVEIILDGDAVPSEPCLEQLWRPHNATYISGSNPAGAFYESNVSLGWDRFAILNENVATFDLAALLQFGKFAHQERYGYLIWEPSDQPSIEGFADSYLGVDNAHVPAGFRYAINIDSSQWRVYSASRTGTAWSDAVLAGATFSTAMSVTLPSPPSPDSRSTAGSLPLPDIVGMPQDALVVTFARSTTASSPASVLVFAANPAGDLGGRLGPGKTPVPAYAEPANVPSPSAWDRPDAVQEATTAGVVVSGDDGASTICLGSAMASSAVLSCYNAVVTPPADVSLVPYSAQLAASFAPSAPGDAAVVLSTRAVSCKEAGAAATGICGIALLASGSGDAGAVSIEAALFNSSGAVVSSASIGSVQRADAASLLEGGLAVAATAAAAAAEPAAMLGGAVVSTGGSVFSRGVGLTAGGKWCIGVAACTGSGGRSLPAAMQQTHVGSGADIAVVTSAATSGGVVVADTHNDGFCQNSETHNKQPFPSTCVFAQLNATSTPGVLNYNAGAWLDWATQAEGGDAAGHMQTPCSTSVLAGSFSMGSGRPAPWLFSGSAASPAGADTTHAVALVVTHDGLPADAKDTGGCGIARAQDGVVVDGFSFSSLAKFA